MNNLTVLANAQLTQFGMGLAKSSHPFLWIIRPDMVIGGNAISPAEFNEETKERGYICSWCPKRKCSTTHRSEDFQRIAVGVLQLKTFLLGCPCFARRYLVIK